MKAPVRQRYPTIKTILTIAGFDPSSGAGITADLAVFASHGLFGTAAITALTVQSTLGVRAVYPVEPHILAQTLDCLTDDLEPSGIKIGMLATSDNVQTVLDFIGRLRQRSPSVPIVLDPVLHSSSGRDLLDPAAVDLLRDQLLPLVDWITPNLDELALLTATAISNPDQMELAATSLQRQSNRLNIVATGGHLDPPDDLVLLRDGNRHWLRGTRQDSRATHGTGCAFSSSLAAGLVAGLDGLTAAQQAKSFVAQAIRHAPNLGSGSGPLNLRSHPA